MPTALEGDYYRIVAMDSGNYREKREKTLENLGEKIIFYNVIRNRPQRYAGADESL